ncbi:MAG TPA: succinyl-diaminopimelate desuccinylase [Acidimicrobiales bacterium]|nr:succinyl-diaminopimelate desuccinylase [Acidimicrobiales bacterium]
MTQPLSVAGDLLWLTAALVDVPSVSRSEAQLADVVEAALDAVPELIVLRVGDSVVARSEAGRERRVLLAGHLDTVPPFGDVSATVHEDAVSGLGAVDMKGGLAVMLSLAGEVARAAVDVTFVFYAGEEIERDANALAAMARDGAAWLQADMAVLGEPTGGVVEAGCQGTMRAVIRVGGRRAHTARPWTGTNAVHRLGAVLRMLDDYAPRPVELEGCVYTEQLQAVRVEGGVAGNVVPDSASVTVNYRFAPDRDAAAAERELRRMFASVLDEEAGDRLEVVDVAEGAPPALANAFVADLVEATGAPARAKVGWTDVATLASLGIPSANFGPGDPLLAHTPDERVTRQELVDVRRVLARLLGLPGDGVGAEDRGR